MGGGVYAQCVCGSSGSLLNAYAGAARCSASKEALLGALKAYHTVFGGMNGKVTADVGAFTSDFRSARLADEYFAGAYFLATKALNTKALARVIVDVLT